MKKIFGSIFVLALLLLVFAGCQNSAPAANRSTPQISPETSTEGSSAPVGSDPAETTASAPTGQTAKTISREEAQAIALEHAGFTADQVRFLETDLDRDDGVLHYDVEFEKDGYDYDYEIDAETGKILKAQKEPD